MCREPVTGLSYNLSPTQHSRKTDNMFTVLVAPCRLAGVDWLRREIDGFIDYVKASPPADPKLPVLVPGEPERIAHNERARTGIEVDAHDLGRDPRRRGGG